jgi:molybdate transport system substrate-binding protein
MSMAAGKRSIILLAVGILLAGGAPLYGAEKLTVAVASNFMLPFEELARIFTERTDIPVEVTFTSTGKLYSQIRTGAPYDLFLAADEVRPEGLFREGLAERPFVYARGRVVLWSARKDLAGAGDWRKALGLPWVKRIAIANPETAPYGAVPMAVLRGTGLLAGVGERLVFAQTVSQAFQYAHTEAAQVGFCALSSALSERGREGGYLPMKEARAVVQAACVLKGTGNRAGAQEFASFLRSPEAGAVKGKYGYE